MALRPSERSAVNNEPVWYPECRRLSRQGGPLGRASICTLGVSVAQRPPRERDCRWSPFSSFHLLRRATAVNNETRRRDEVRVGFTFLLST